MNLDDLRKKIDAIDDKLMEVYIERTKLVKAVADYKKKHDIAILNSNREMDIIKSLVEKFGEDYKQDIYSLYPGIMNVSKLRQARENRSSEIHDIIHFSKQQYKGDQQNLNIKVQGVEGAYSMLAAKEMFKNCDISYEKTFEDVFQAISQGKADYGVVPIENSNAGSVNEVYDLLSKYKLTIAKAKQYEISHCLIALPTAEIEDIKTVFSHAQALYQCKNYIHNNKWETVSKANTALSAEDIAKLQDKSVAAIASEKTAELYGLKILQKDIQDQKNNFTRFIAICKENIINDKANKISLFATLEHKQGSLLQLLNIIASYNVNMTKLESRPIPGRSFEFLFYFDVVGNVKDKDIQQMLFDIYEYSASVTFLGGYEEQ